MTDDERNDRREGYADGLADHYQSDRGDTYDAANDDGRYDRWMIKAVTEWKRRAALPVPA